MGIESWRSGAGVVAGPGGRETGVEVHIPVPADSGAGTVLGIAVVVVLVIIGLFIPPVLLLNLPILMVRAAFLRLERGRFELVDVGPFACPACGAEAPAARQIGVLPLEFSCPACQVPLQLRPAPRRNLVLEPPGAE